MLEERKHWILTVCVFLFGRQDFWDYFSFTLILNAKCAITMNIYFCNWLLK